MLKIRLSRVGRKHEPVYRLILVESTEPAKTGKAIEVLGNYDSRNSEKGEFKADRITYWMSMGAQVSDTVHNLLLRKSIIKGEKRNVVAPKVFKALRAKQAASAAEDLAAKEAQKAAEVVIETAPETPIEEAPAPVETPVADSAEAIVEPKEEVVS